MLSRVLELTGYDAVVAANGREALAALGASEVDVVLCDIGLPGMSGLELARRIRANPRSHHVLLIALTGYGQPEDRQRTLEAGFDQHLTKPVNLKVLQEVLATARP
ncbi:MAG: response regulator [Myxococcales bacterium]|nr:response regulator [Myxococcales bacterium]